MKCLKFTIALCVMFAAAILFPLRRAQAAFASRTESASISNAARPKIRRRPGRAPVVVREAADTQTRDLSTHKAVRGPGRRRRTVMTVAHVRTVAAAKHTARSSEAPARQSHHATPAQDDYAPPGRVASLAKPERLAAPAPTPPLSVSTQVVGDIPEPPPKLSL